MTATVVGVLLLASPASAAVDDDFSASTTGGGCGEIEFVDYGPGAAGGGNNDDYVVLHDYCADGHGVRAEVTFYLNGTSVPGNLGRVYNGNGQAGAPVIWDPFAGYDNVWPGDRIILQVCLVDGVNDPTPSQCGRAEHVSVDG